jgi:hypothetical protein
MAGTFCCSAQMVRLTNEVVGKDMRRQESLLQRLPDVRFIIQNFEIDKS